MNPKEAYVIEMESWINNQKLLEDQIEKDIEYCHSLLTYNKQQLKYHRDNVEKVTKGFKEWKKANGIK